MGPYFWDRRRPPNVPEAVFFGSFFILMLRGCILDPKDASFDLNS